MSISRNRYAARVLAVASSALLLSACGDSDVAPEVVDNNQIISQANAEANAKSFARARYPDFERVLFQSDSTITPSCRFGDGWASGTIDTPAGVVKVKCQTTGSGKGLNGCMLEGEFRTKAYAKQDGQCDESITSLKKIAG